MSAVNKIGSWRDFPIISSKYIQREDGFIIYRIISLIDRRATLRLSKKSIKKEEIGCWYVRDYNPSQAMFNENSLIISPISEYIIDPATNLAELIPG